MVYRSATGQRVYTDVAPTLRSLTNTGGKHHGGSGAWKVVEYKGEEYLVSNQFPEEASRLGRESAYLFYQPFKAFP